MNTNKRISKILELGRQRKKRRLDLQRASYANRVNFGKHVAFELIHESFENVAQIHNDQLTKEDASFITSSDSDFPSTNSSIHNESNVQDLRQQQSFHSSSSEDIDQLEITSSDDAPHSNDQSDSNLPDSNGTSNDLD